MKEAPPIQVLILRTVPGLTNGTHATEGTTHDFPDGLALSLINDGYAELVRATDAEQRETATIKRPPGRPRKEG